MNDLILRRLFEKQETKYHFIQPPEIKKLKTPWKGNSFCLSVFLILKATYIHFLLRLVTYFIYILDIARSQY